MENNQFNGLDPNLAVQMVANYAASLPQGASRSVWFSMEQIQSFLDQINNTGLPCSQLGVRVYLATYPSIGYDENETQLTFNPEYAGMDTVIMVPTYNNNTGRVNARIAAIDGLANNPDWWAQHYGAMDSTDFDPSMFSLNEDGSQSFAGWDDIMQPNQPDTLTMLNHGGLIPPPWPKNRVTGAEEDFESNEALFMGYVDAQTATQS